MSGEPLRVLLVTTWEQACGIAEHSAMLKEAVEAADPGIVISPTSELDPTGLVETDFRDCELVHLNYQAALHSRWTPGWIRAVQALERKVLVTYHDTGVPNAEQCKAVIDAADAAVVHEPFDDLPEGKTRYWRMGVPGWSRPYQSRREVRDHRPVLGTVGFPFPWKCYDTLCETAAGAGWGIHLIAPGATDEQIAEWCRRSQGQTVVSRKFFHRDAVVRMLSQCDATAFTYVCHNTGQSGAILLGIAARKPVLALSTCRQFRALYEDPLGKEAISWCRTFEEIAYVLPAVPIQRCDPMMVALAEQESWTRLGKKYADLYRELAR